MNDPAGPGGEPIAGEGILADVKVVEFAQNIAVPHCGRLLAGMGADVVKVEPPDGDAMRYLAPVGAFEGRGFALANPGKRAIVLDLDTEPAREIVDRLFAWADVALVAFKLNDRERYGLDWEHARSVNPRLVYLGSNAFGPEGDDAHVGGYDVLAQARSGVGFIMNRVSNGAPAATRPAVNDTGTGIVSALGVVAALRHRDQTGEGQKVDTSLLGTALSLGTPMIVGFERDRQATEELAADIEIARAAGVDFEGIRDLYESRVSPAAGAFKLYFRTYLTADGMIAVAGLTASLHAKFHAATGIPTPGAPGPSGTGGEIGFDEVVEAAEARFRERTTAEWAETLRAVEYPCGPYNLPYEALDDPQIRANDYIVDFEHPTIGRYSASGMPLRFSAAPGPALARSPMFGEHTREVLAELGLAARSVEELVADGVVRDGPPQDL